MVSATNFLSELPQRLSFFKDLAIEFSYLFIIILKTQFEKYFSHFIMFDFKEHLAIVSRNFNYFMVSDHFFEVVKFNYFFIDFV